MHHLLPSCRNAGFPRLQRAWTNHLPSKQLYIWSNELTDRGKKKMAANNISLNKDGMKVGVRQLSDEDYAAAQQK